MSAPGNSADESPQEISFDSITRVETKSTVAEYGKLEGEPGKRFIRRRRGKERRVSKPEEVKPELAQKGKIRAMASAFIRVFKRGEKRVQ